MLLNNAKEQDRIDEGFMKRLIIANNFHIPNYFKLYYVTEVKVLKEKLRLILFTRRLLGWCSPN
jgi:hypothetical protein